MIFIHNYNLYAFAKSSMLKVNPTTDSISNFLIILLENNLNPLVGSFVGNDVNCDSVKEVSFTSIFLTNGADRKSVV